MSDTYTPYFLDSNDNEVHIGDMVTYAFNRGGHASIKSGSIAEISYRLVNEEVVPFVKLAGRSQFMQGVLVTLIGEDTLRDKLRRLVAAVGGRMNEDAIEATAASIESGNESEDGE